MENQFLVRLTFIFLLTIGLSRVVFGQEVVISNGSYTGCEGVLLDSGGNEGEYSENESFTFVLCPENPETIVNLSFVIFDLGLGDVLTIYNGDSTDGPVLGSFSGNQGQGQSFQGSTITGCLTIMFISDNTGNGNFAGTFGCGPLCVPPIPVVTTNELEPIRICAGEEVQFDGSGSIPAEGQQIVSWVWGFGDGEENSTDGQTTAHVYTEEGAYLVTLSLIDDNDCASTATIDLYVFVSTTPEFDETIINLDVCEGQQNVTLTGIVETVEWSDVPSVNLGGFIFLPDEQGECFESTLSFDLFEAGSVVESPEDFDNLFVNMEHSYMGDLVITLICPNGQSLIVHQQGGVGTYLGEPVDVDGTPDDAGVGYDYFWSPDATLGTWEEESGGVATLPSGTYSSVQNWDFLEGCPLNGDWTIEICDLFSSDNGFIFDWGLVFNPELYPDLITFEPSIGDSCDSTYWEGPNIISTSAECDEIEIQTGGIGSTEYTFIATDNFGCTYEQITTVNVLPGPDLSSTSDSFYYCGQPLTINGEISNPEAGVNYSYSWSPSELLTNPNTASPTVNGIEEDTDFTLTVTPDNLPDCNVEFLTTVIIPDMPVIFEPDTIISCAGDVVLLSTLNQPSEWDYVYNWFYNDEIEPFSSQGGIEAVESGVYTLQVSMLEPCFFTVSEEIEVIFESCDIGFIPNVISPNADGKNDMFRIEGLDFFDGSTLEIYNRWGGLVFESSDYSNNWSPTEADVAEGTYYFILGVNFPKGMEMFHGELTILRN